MCPFDVNSLNGELDEGEFVMDFQTLKFSRNVDELPRILYIRVVAAFCLDPRLPSPNLFIYFGYTVYSITLWPL